MGRWMRGWTCGIAVSALASGCTSFVEEPSAWLTESDGDARASSTGAAADGGAADTTGGGGSGVTTMPPTSAPPTTAPTDNTTSTAGSESDGETTGDDNVDPTRSDSTGVEDDTEADPTDESDSDDPTSGGRELDGCETTQLPEQIFFCSEDIGANAELTVSNNCNTASVDVYWVNFDCGEVFIDSVSPGQGTVIDSYASHPFRVRNSATGALLLQIDPLTPGDHTVEVL